MLQIGFCFLFLQVSGFVATLRLFFIYGINSRQQFTASPTVNKEKELSLAGLKLNSKEPIRKDNTPYRPPHLRKKDSVYMKQPKAQDSLCLSDHESCATDFMSSDSDCSDSDVSGKDTDGIQSSKVRVAAIECIQVNIIKLFFLALKVFTAICLSIRASTLL